MEPYEKDIVFQDVLAPSLVVEYRGRKVSILTHGKEGWPRVAFVDGLYLHILTFDKDLKTYILESLEPRGAGVRRLQSIASVDEIKVMNDENNPDGNEAIVAILAADLAYVSDSFKEVHEEAEKRAESMRSASAVTDDEKLFYSTMLNAHRLSASQRKQIREQVIPHLKKTGNFPAPAAE